MQRRCERNRNRSKRRAIYCPIHNRLLDSASAKYPLFADQAGQLQARGMGRKAALLLISNATTVSLQGEWIEAFWCQDCQTINWYHVRKSERTYNLSVAPVELWQQAAGVIYPDGNASVGEFTRKQSRIPTLKNNVYINSI
ncbi:hypothetical protein Q2T42_07225 [Leptolyngbya boryana CZ1]|uniref:Uncharacterized protein n=1 Tax=Leptolyngbya boryana CZ1 TaxID=3060204 RepID=A0AA97AXR0_LEPBY|nr:hypothetical protein [Leptolyngbya boryana]WNZ47621.1 hypothetical protein Q2T42_07225 [Leptolyngbya boryana CZ1]